MQQIKQENLRPVYYILKQTHPQEKVFDEDQWSITANMGGPISLQIENDANGYRLPTPKEFQLAWLGGYLSHGHSNKNVHSNKKFSGDTPNKQHNVDDYSWHAGNAQGIIHPVKQKNPNELGLYDMSGNAAELCYSDKVEVLGGGSTDTENLLNHARTTDISHTQLLIEPTTASDKTAWTYQAELTADFSQEVSERIHLVPPSGLSLPKLEMITETLELTNATIHAEAEAGVAGTFSKGKLKKTAEKEWAWLGLWFVALDRPIEPIRGTILNASVPAEKHVFVGTHPDGQALRFNVQFPQDLDLTKHGSNLIGTMKVRVIPVGFRVVRK